MIYIGSPYHHPKPLIRNHRYILARNFTARLMKRGFVAISPIVIGHHMREHHGLSDAHEFWMPFDLGILKNCEAMYYLQLDGWEESKGLGIELNVCKMLGMAAIPFAAENNSFTLVDKAWDGVVPEVL